MNFSELEYLCSEQAQKDLRAHRDCDPLKVAMNKHIEHSSLVATQVKNLQKAQKKLPSYYDAMCIIPTLGFEQSSSENLAQSKQLEGDLCIDLTCGLGVDSYYLSKRFARVISLERDELMARVAKINFERLGAKNIEVINCSAEDFLANFRGKAHLVYADPDRRNAEGKKQVLLEDCSPNMLDLKTLLETIADKTMIKCSPIFDISEAFRLYGEHTTVEVISQGGECKEVVILSDKTILKPQITVNALAKKPLSFELDAMRSRGAEMRDLDDYKYMIIPDVALQKSRCAVSYYSGFEGVFIENNNSIALSINKLDEPYGQQFEIESLERFVPKQLKKQLKVSGIKSVEILKRNFAMPTEQLASALSVKQGGEIKIMFAELQKTKYAIKIK